MTRLACASLVAVFLLACQGARSPHAPADPGDTGGEGGDTAGSGGSVAGTGGGAAAGTGGSGGTGSAGGVKPSGDTGGAGGTAEPDAASGGDGGSGEASDASAPDALMSMLDGAHEASDPGGDILPGRPYIHLCKKDWTQMQCCEFLCACLNEHCTDAPRAVPGIATCMPTCLKLSNMTMRCHVYHCFEAKGPDFKDHESHCAHAANTLNGGGCPTGVY